MNRRRRSYCPSIECLERRDTPSNFAVSFNAATATLSIVGDSSGEAITVEGNAANGTIFALSSPNSDTFNGNSSYTSPSGVKNITMQLKGGNSVLFDDAVVPITLQGSLTINGGNGDDFFESTNLSVAKNLSITNNATATTGGGSSTTIDRDSAGYSYIGGNLTITNGIGADGTFVADTNIGGNVTVSNGHGDGMTAGGMEFSNQYDKTARSIIKGNVTVSFLDGALPLDAITDYEVMGNVSINDGTGDASTLFDGAVVDQPVLILGNLSLTGSGSNTVFVGDLLSTGMIVGGNFTITSPASKSDTSPTDGLEFNHLQVDGNASFALGAGADTDAFGNSVFVGSLTLDNGSNSGNVVSATNVDIDRNLSITDGRDITLTDLTVRGSVAIANNSGLDTSTILNTDAAIFNDILGNFTLTNGVGADFASISDTNIGGNITVNDGQGNALGNAGATWIHNVHNTATQAVIGGNVSISYVTGNVQGVLVNQQFISDTEVKGNVTFANGSGNFVTAFDGSVTSLPVNIRGNLTISGSGNNTVNVGTGSQKTGLLVGKNFTLSLGAGTTMNTSTDTLDLNNLAVYGTSAFGLATANDSVTIDQSIFHGSFSLNMGSNGSFEEVNLETGASDSTALIFEGSVLITFGFGQVQLTAPSVNPGQEIEIYDTFVVDAKVDSQSLFDHGHEVFPFGNSIVWK